MDVISVLLLIGGLIALAAGGEVLVRGATGLARAIGLSPLVVGLTVVSFATSAPELAVTLQGAFAGNPGIAVGNVVGSNIANVLLVLGICAVLLPLAVRSQLIKTDIPVVIGISVLALVLALDGTVGRFDGGVLLTILVIYLIVVIVLSRRRWAATAAIADRQGKVGAPPATRHPAIAVILIVVGVGFLVLGARLLVTGAIDVAAALGVSDLVIGLTVVSVGTSLPELAASIVAAIRGERDLAVGNVVGSCLFNIGAVLGLTGLLVPGGVPVEPAAINFDFPVMIAVAFVLVPVAFTGYAINRWEGAVLAAYYIAYVAYLFLDAAGHAAVEPFSSVMLGFVIPITALWLVLLVAYEIGLRRGRRQGMSGWSDPGESGYG